MWTVAFPIMIVSENSKGGRALIPVFGTLLIVGWFVMLMCVLAAWINTVLLLRRTTQAGPGRVLFPIAAVPVSWAVCGAIAMLAMPWAVGLVWLMIDSLR